ncbi:MAG: FmdB family transcriptional regulator [Desulfobacteraceae bacterium 4572_130]|nr:MAG: FmdB family transcriptional regulator [Desulfobacteraceae bacterium 4572_130]
MPIYEFKCLKCEEFFEMIVLNNDEEDKIKCPKCNNVDFERVVSTTNYVMGNNHNNDSPSKQTRNCSSGSCSTYTIPGATRD